MEDKAIVNLYFERNEGAISETEAKYGHYLFCIANNVLINNEDAQECVNDTYKSAWDTIPPNSPHSLRAYLGKIARNHAINRYNFNSADKRNKNLELSLSEMEEFLPSPDFSEESTFAITFEQALNKFLRDLPEAKCNMFLLRYWYFLEIKDISAKMGMSEGRVKVTLARIRERLKKYLEKEGLHI